MRLDGTKGELRLLAEHLFDFIARTPFGRHPGLRDFKLDRGVYGVRLDGRHPLFLEIVGQQGRDRQNAIKLSTQWSDRFAELGPQVQEGTDMHGGATADLWVSVAGGDPDRQFAERFIRVALVE